jgi:hypothetical protein
MKIKPPEFSGIIICQLCGKEVKKNGAMQKYCEECSQKKDRERKQKWANAHPINRTKEEIQTIRENKTSVLVSRGKAINEGVKHNVSHFSEVDLQWFVKVSVPFSYAASKNHIWATNGYGHIHRRKESVAMEEEIFFAFKRALVGRKIFQNKIWLDIFVQKPDHRGDAINVLDLVADALKKAIEIDDRWFSVRRIDWEVVKENPKLFIGIGQEDTWDAKLCSYCGRILPIENFGKSKRECRECTNARKKHNFKTAEQLNEEYKKRECAGFCDIRG